MFRESEERHIKHERFDKKYGSRFDAILACTSQTVTGFNKSGRFAISCEVLGIACLISFGFINLLCPKEDCNSNVREAMMPLVGIGIISIVLGIFSGLKCYINVVSLMK